MWKFPNEKPHERLTCWVTVDTILGRQVCMAYYENGKWYNMRDKETHIIVWQYVNIPEPYTD